MSLEWSPNSLLQGEIALGATVQWMIRAIRARMELANDGYYDARCISQVCSPVPCHSKPESQATPCARTADDMLD